MHELLEFGVIAVLSAAYFEWWAYGEANFKRFVYSLWVLFVPDGLQSWGIHYFGTRAKSCSFPPTAVVERAALRLLSFLMLLSLLLLWQDNTASTL